MAMTCKERVTAAMNRENLDRPPVAVFTQSATIHQMDTVGAAWPEAHKDAALMAKLAAAQNTVNGTECYRTCFCLTAEAERLGCTVAVDKKDAAPGIKDHPYHFDAMMGEYDDIESKLAEVCSPEDFINEGRVNAIVESCKILKKDYDSENVPIVAGNTGPFTLTGNLVDTENLIFGMMMDEGKVFEWVTVINKYVLAYCQALIDAGADIIQMSEPSGSCDMLSPEMFTPAAGQFVGASLGATKGGLGNILHICGDTSPILKDMVACGGQVKGVSIEEKVDPFKAYELVGGTTTLVGNVGSVNPLYMGSPADVAAGTLNSIKAGFSIISSGCGISPLTPNENYQAMVDTTKNYSA